MLAASLAAARPGFIRRPETEGYTHRGQRAQQPKQAAAGTGDGNRSGEDGETIEIHSEPPTAQAPRHGVRRIR